MVGLVRAEDLIQSAGLDGPHRWGLMLPTSARVALPTYIPLITVRYVELVRWAEDLQRYVIGSHATGGLRNMPHGVWDRRGRHLGRSDKAVAAQVAIVLKSLQGSALLMLPSQTI